MFQRWPLSGVTALPKIPISLVLEGGSACSREMKPLKISSNKEGGFFNRKYILFVLLQGCVSVPPSSARSLLPPAFGSRRPPLSPSLINTAPCLRSGCVRQEILMQVNKSVLHYMKLFWITYGVVRSIQSHI